MQLKKSLEKHKAFLGSRVCRDGRKVQISNFKQCVCCSNLSTLGIVPFWERKRKLKKVSFLELFRFSF